MEQPLAAAASAGRCKYIWYSRTGEEPLFDLENDPRETTDVSTRADYDETRSRLAAFLVLAGLGIPFGFAAAEYLPRQTLELCLGTVLVAAGLSRLLEHWRRREWRPPAWALALLLAAGGVIHGAFGSGGATLTVYARYALKEKSAFRGTLSVMWVILNAIVIGGLIMEGQVGPNVAVVALAGVPAILLATWLGHKLAERLSQERFSDLVSVLLFFAGGMMIARNLFA